MTTAEMKKEKNEKLELFSIRRYVKRKRGILEKRANVGVKNEI